MANINFEIKEKVGVIKTYSTGWTKEINIVSWNNGTPKFDIRDWDSEHEHMSRGTTLNEIEARELYEILKNRFEIEN